MTISAEVFPENLPAARLANNPPPERADVRALLTAQDSAGWRGAEVPNNRALHYLINARCVERVRSSWYGPWYRITERGAALLEELRASEREPAQSGAPLAPSGI
jgi:hypothetical protein